MTIIRKSPSPARGRSRRRSGLCLGLAGGLFFWGIAAAQNKAQDAGKPGSDPAVFRFGFSSAMFPSLNVNDAKAAVRVWALTLAREQGIKADPIPFIFNSLAELDEALRRKQVDAVAVLTEEYRALSTSFPLAPLFVANVNGHTAEELIVLVRRDSGIANPEDLRGRSLITHRDPQASLALPWLDTLLLEKGLRPTADFLGRVSSSDNLAHVILPVFFRQSEACLVTRSGFDTMTELNPQVGLTLMVLASSPKMVPVLLCIRADYTSSSKDEILQGLRDLHLSPAGRQVLTIFRSGKLEELPASSLKTELDLLERREKLGRKAGPKAPQGRGE